MPLLKLVVWLGLMSMLKVRDFDDLFLLFFPPNLKFIFHSLIH